MAERCCEKLEESELDNVDSHLSLKNNRFRAAMN